ncbi:FHA domain-containing protein [Acidithiobacillus ferrooxidans]|uniref:FHA domain-containing protein n=1 Tax=Acidithiobacillus ferrooxidans TaxID=920 RepID=UPI001C07424A|nr:FHA domain-containing protein [Acidithiobacillus ferrooxidans]MBU2857003.1 FHA domain-containing protein [Acidithiobacillus ferrooxidans]MBU2858905.1 FHA domain-containing protein [Acidithiobacillus ferrooxidans]
MEGFQLWVSGGHRKVVEPIQCVAEHCTLGKDDQNLVVLQGWSIAPVHARIARRADGLYVEDLGSRIGTLVNGSRIVSISVCDWSVFSRDQRQGCSPQDPIYILAVLSISQ